MAPRNRGGRTKARQDNTPRGFKTWHFQTSEESSPDVPLTEHDRDKFFQGALKLISTDAETMQSVIKNLASDAGTKRILHLTKEDFPNLPSPSQDDILQHSLLPFFKVITYPKVLNSGLLETSVDTIFTTIFGPGGQNAIKLFEFISTKAETLSIEDLEPTVAVFAKVLELNGTAQYSIELAPIVDLLSAAVNSTKYSADDTSSFGALKWLERARKQLGVGQSITTKSDANAASSEAQAQPEFRRDGPGRHWSSGLRHDNDSEDIRSIRILPTYEEIVCERDPYLPTLDPSSHHLTGIHALLDRHFRLYREDQIGPVRDAIKQELSNTQKKFSGFTHARNGVRVNTYSRLSIRRLFCDKLQGFVLTVSIDQPKEIRRIPRDDREDWWEMKKRLRKDALVCILGLHRQAIFCTVSEIRDEQRRHPYAKNGEQMHSDKLVLEDFKTNPDRAILTLAPVEQEDIFTLVDYFARQNSSDHLTLLEFPNIMVQSFKPTLEALQKMIKTGDVPFADLLAPTSPLSDRPAVDPPAYALRPNFRFELDCLLKDRKSCRLHPRKDFDVEALIKDSTLDGKQAEALVNAFSRRLALCQGPPGTGKSYTALAFTRAFVASKEAGELGPLLIVTYTNHALDQDLEHCLDSGIERIIRMGSRSKSSRLEDLNIRMVSKAMERTRTEKSEADSRSRALGREALGVEQVLSEFGDDVRDLKTHLMEKYPEHHALFWGRDARSSPGLVIQMWLKDGFDPDRMGPPPRTAEKLLKDEVDFRQMLLSERRLLHTHWMTEVQESRRSRLRRALKRFRRAKKQHDAARQEIDLRCLGEANIIGVTTSGLARQLDLLRRVPIKVVLVEEAGEVLEAHTLTALLPSVEHAFLIGDHQQLRPTINNFELSSESHGGKKYSLDMSLFERLISPPAGVPGAKLPFATLETQRRMHPSISDLIRQTLYPRLTDGSHVSLYPNIAGVEKRLFWLDHQKPETGADTDDLATTSKSNDHEVNLTASLVAHLLSQGEYQSQDIAVITPYLAQLFKIRTRLANQYEIVLDERDVDALEQAGIADLSKDSAQPVKTASLLQRLKVASVDNFQGEEAKVVIVPLVRSNQQKNCGFLKTSNRINVLLSRAKHGMYIIGNSNTYGSVPMWSKVISLLKDQGNIGNNLNLCCPRHPDNPIQVATPDDFARHSPEGGCALKCDRPLKCGHTCTLKCHSDLRHDNVKCLEACTRLKQGCDHPCRKACFEKCDPTCQEMLKDVNVELPCGHIIKDLRCWELQNRDEYPCNKMVTKVVPKCGHTVKVNCHIVMDSFLCPVQCGTILDCKHICKAKCGDCRFFDGPLLQHPRCPQHSRPANELNEGMRRMNIGSSQDVI